MGDVPPMQDDLAHLCGPFQDVCRHCICKIDIDNSQGFVIEVKILAVPTFMFFGGKNAMNKFLDADKVQLKKFVKEL